MMPPATIADINLEEGRHACKIMRITPFQCKNVHFMELYTLARSRTYKQPHIRVNISSRLDNARNIHAHIHLPRTSGVIAHRYPFTALSQDSTTYIPTQ
jgi:hypothetical protein